MGRERYDGRFRWRMDDQPLSIQFVIAGGVVALFSFVSLVLLLRQVGQQADATRWLGETHRRIGLLNTLGRDFYRQNSAFQAFLKTHDDQYLAKAREGHNLWVREHSTLDRALVQAKSEKERFLDMSREYDRWWQAVHQFMITSVQYEAKTGKTMGIEPALRRELSIRFREIWTAIDDLIQSESDILKERDQVEKGRVRDTFTFVAFINVALILLFGVMLMRLYWGIARPISALSAALFRYQDGQLSTRVSIVNRNEIGFLGATFNEMAEKIEHMVGDLRKVDVLKSEFVSTVSHELRTPLTSIGGYAKLLLASDAGPVTDIQKEFLAIIVTNVERLTNLINDLLDVEKIESGKVQLLREPVDIASILKECRDTFGIVAAQKGVRLIYEVPFEGIQVTGDRNRLIQVFMNLLSNAIKYTKEGSVEFRAEVLGRDRVRVSIQDTGIGMSQEEQEKLFQRFYRAQSGLSSPEGGTGLGLVIVKGLVESHKGKIEVESESGVGTTFSVTLPLRDIIAADVAVSQVPILASEEGVLVWLIDNDLKDIEETRNLFTHVSEGVGQYRFRIREFDHFESIPAESALEEHPSLIVVDPGGMGGERTAVSEIQKHLKKDVPILVVGAHIDAAAAFSEGAAAVLKKPLKRARFAASVNNLISKSGYSILLADSDPDFRLLLKRSMVQRGFRVDDIDRGNQVLNRLEKEHYDLVLIDDQFPDVSGIELIKIVRRIPRFEKVPIVLMSEVDIDESTRSELSNWEENRFMTKSVGISGIVDNVCQVLEALGVTGEAR